VAEAGRYLTIIAVLLISAWLVILGVRGPRSRTTRVADGPPDEPYRVYTREFDLELHAGEIANLLPDVTRDWGNTPLQSTPTLWELFAGRTAEIVARHQGAIARCFPELRAAAGLDPGDVAIALLIDHSGSLKGEPIAHAAAAAASTTALRPIIPARRR
jgi:cobaltochelatase CobT